MVFFMIISFICIDLLKLLSCISRFEGKSIVQLPMRYVQLKLYPPCLILLNFMFAILMIRAIFVVLGRCLILHHDNYVYSYNKPKIVQVLSMHCSNVDLCYCCITAGVSVSPEMEVLLAILFDFFLLPPCARSIPVKVVW